MALTPSGAAHVLAMAAGLSADPIASIRVSSAEGTAVAAVASAEVVPVDGAGATLMVTATFGEREANFDWLRREVITQDGVVIDLLEEDGGRKVLGAIWDVTVEINLAAEA